jgi:hypothetical protein
VKRKKDGAVGEASSDIIVSHSQMMERISQRRSDFPYPRAQKKQHRID